MNGRRFAAGLVGLVVATASAGAFDWITDSKLVIGTFGQERLGGFNRGLTLAVAPEETVRPIDSGEVVFFHDEQATRQRNLPSGLGSFLVLLHDQKPRLRSRYEHLNLPPGLDLAARHSISRTDVISRGGGSGYAVGSAVNLAVVDQEVPQYVNPLLLLPSVADTTRPVIRGLELRNKTERLPFSQAARVTEGEWDLLGELYDPAERVRFFVPLAPYRIAVFVNGKESFRVTFDALKETRDELTVAPASAPRFADLYHDNRNRLGTVVFNKGLTTIEIVVKDYQGNERSISQQFRVQ